MFLPLQVACKLFKYLICWCILSAISSMLNTESTLNICGIAEHLSGEFQLSPHTFKGFRILEPILLKITQFHSIPQSLTLGISYSSFLKCTNFILQWGQGEDGWAQIHCHYYKFSGSNAQVMPVVSSSQKKDGIIKKIERANFCTTPYNLFMLCKVKTEKKQVSFKNVITLSLSQNDILIRY